MLNTGTISSKVPNCVYMSSVGPWGGGVYPHRPLSEAVAEKYMINLAYLYNPPRSPRGGNDGGSPTPPTRNGSPTPFLIFGSPTPKIMKLFFYVFKDKKKELYILRPTKRLNSVPLNG